MGGPVVRGWSVAVLVLLLAMMGCGDGHQAETVDAPKAVDGQPTTTPSQLSSRETPVATEEPEGPDGERLLGALITLSDLPAGWTTATPETANDDEPTNDVCGIEGEEIPSTGEAQVGFQQSTFGPFLFQVLTSYKEAEARRAMDQVVEIMRQCSEWTEPGDSGPVTWRLSPLSFPKLGDQTFAARMSTDDVPLFGTAQIDMVFIRRGNMVTSVAYMALGPSAAAPGPTESVAKIAEERMRALRSR